MTTTNEELRHLLNRKVKVVNLPNLGSYQGRLVGFRPGKFVISGLAIMNPDGSCKAAPKHRSTRWFHTERCEVSELPSQD